MAERRYPETPADAGIGAETAGEGAQVIAAVVHLLPPQTQTDLKRLLARSLSDPTPAQRRNARLGLLLDLLEDESGQIPTVAEYEALRQARRCKGENWPAHTTLIRALWRLGQGRQNCHVSAPSPRQCPR